MTKRIEEAINIIKMNDRGGYTVPTGRLYPYQWNWDSGFTALGIWQFNKWRAWLEIIALLDAQWQDGMIPHIVFRHNDPDYFPGPDVWSTNTEPPTSGHSQPPVLSSIIWQIVQQGTDYDARKAREVFPKLMAYHGGSAPPATRRKRVSSALCIHGNPAVTTVPTGISAWTISVSYTHLTLPTILLV